MICFQGGQILRISLALSVLYKIPIHVLNIRANRSKPGLMAQHLKGIFTKLVFEAKNFLAALGTFW